MKFYHLTLVSLSENRTRLNLNKMIWNSIIWLWLWYLCLFVSNMNFYPCFWLDQFKLEIFNADNCPCSFTSTKNREKVVTRHLCKSFSLHFVSTKRRLILIWAKYCFDKESRKGGDSSSVQKFFAAICFNKQTSHPHLCKILF